MSNEILFPPGRLVGGDLYEGQTTDAEGAPRIVKNGPNKGQSYQMFYFACAIPKVAGHTSWTQTDWGAKIYSIASAAFPRGQCQSPTFAWKITDGDSTVPNRKGVAPVTREGYPGHWVLSFASTGAPRICNNDGSQWLIENGHVKPGYFIQVYGDVAGNESDNQPGIYLNHRIVSFQGFGPEIHWGPDAAKIGFGGAPLPAGASQAPVGGGFTPPAVPPPAAPVAPTAVATPTAVKPVPAFLTPPAAAPAAPAPAAPPAPPAARVLTAKAQGATYEQYVAAGWTDDQLRQNGLMA